jgi:hypothetical protein
VFKPAVTSPACPDRRSRRFTNCDDAQEHGQHTDGRGLQPTGACLPLPCRNVPASPMTSTTPAAHLQARITRSALASRPVHRDRAAHQRHLDGEAPAMLMTPSRPTALIKESRIDPPIGMTLNRVPMPTLTELDAYGQSLPYEQRRSTTGTGRGNEVPAGALVNCMLFLRCDLARSGGRQLEGDLAEPSSAPQRRFESPKCTAGEAHTTDSQPEGLDHFESAQRSIGRRRMRSESRNYCAVQPFPQHYDAKG